MLKHTKIIIVLAIVLSLSACVREQIVRDVLPAELQKGADVALLDLPVKNFNNPAGVNYIINIDASQYGINSKPSANDKDEEGRAKKEWLDNYQAQIAKIKRNVFSEAGVSWGKVKNEYTPFSQLNAILTSAEVESLLKVNGVFIYLSVGMLPY